MHYGASMRILQLSDTHLGVRSRPPIGAPPDWSRAEDHRSAFERALALADDADLVVHTGDLFDRSRPPRKAAEETNAALAAVARRVPVVVLRGNHDRRGLHRNIRPTPGLTVVDVAERIVVRGFAIGAVPHFYSATGWAAAARVAEGADLLIAHQSFHGSTVPGFRFRVGHPVETVGAEHLPAGVRAIATGHLHPRQVVRVGDATVVHCGSTERTSFTERLQSKGVVRWTFGATANWEMIALPSRPMLVVATPDDLDRIRPGSLVRAASPALDREAVARGGWVYEHVERKVPVRRIEPQMALL
jgi:DNA repair exonuclease SbcCD nuclease subunit